MHTQSILDQFAETLWVNAWADWAEENDCLPGQCELTEVMPQIPATAMAAAQQLYNEISKLNGSYGLFRKIEVVANRDNTTVEYLAHYLVMEALGSGVCYEDDYPAHGIQVVNYCEVISCDGVEMDLCI